MIASNSSLGRKFNRLLILGQWQIAKSVQKVLALCDCGVLKEYLLSNLKNGNTKSCGCFKLETTISHGMVSTKGYNTWALLIQRCTNPKNTSFKNYGARGIALCDKWLKFENFYEDMGDRPKGLELDRIDNNKGYSKENCRWVPHRKNGQNTRVSRYWYLCGKRYSSSTEAAERLGVRSSTVIRRCNGYFTRLGNWVQPYPGCYSELKYKTTKTIKLK